MAKCRYFQAICVALVSIVAAGTAAAQPADPLRLLLVETGHQCDAVQRSTTIDGDLVADCGNAIWRIRASDIVEALPAWPEDDIAAAPADPEEGWKRVVFWDEKCRAIKQAWKQGNMPKLHHWKDAYTCQRWVMAWHELN